MRIVKRFTDTEALLRRFLYLARRGGDDWNGSGKLDELLEDAACLLDSVGATVRA